MVFLMLVTFLLTTGLYGFLFWLAFQRVVNHLRGNPEGVKAVTDHVLLPALGRKPKEGKGEVKLEVKRIKGARLV
jgi:hypothetical protein